MSNKFDPEDYDTIKPYFEGGAKKKHKNYQKAVDVYFHMSFHIDGYFKRPVYNQNESVNSAKRDQINPYFQRLIDMRRPNESPTILSYRRNVYKPFTQTVIYGVINSLEKIFKASDYKIDWTDSDVPVSIPEAVELKKYTDKVFPYFESITNWAEKILLKWNMIDPNALCVVMPKTYDIESNVLFEPMPHIIPSKDVYEYKENEYTIFLSPYKTTYMDSDNHQQEGKILCIITTDGFYEARQINKDQQFVIELKYQHNIGTLPAWILGGDATAPDGIVPFYNSYIGSMLPALDEMAAVCSDKQAELIQHMYSEKWYIVMTPCKSCNGGMINSVAAGKQIVCPDCEGKGAIPHEPYQDIVINPQNAMGQPLQVPIPPAGFIEKSTDIIRYLNEEIGILTKQALMSVKMGYLYENPMSKEKESGLAKSYDASETNNFVYKIAFNLMKNIEYVYYYVNEIRYKLMVPNELEREAMLPVIKVPQEYDMITSQTLEVDMKSLADAAVSSVIKYAAEKNYLHAKDPNSPLFKQHQLVHDFDPFPDAKPADKLAMEKSEVIDKLDLCLSNYITDFVKELMSQDKKFYDWKYDDQREKLYEMAATKLEAINQRKEDENSQGSTMSGGTQSGTDMGTITYTDDGIPYNPGYNPTLNVPLQRDADTPGKDEIPRQRERNNMEQS